MLIEGTIGEARDAEFGEPKGFAATASLSETLEAGKIPMVLMGIPLYPVDQRETLERIESMIGSGEARYLVTANVDYLTQAWGDVELRRIVSGADLVIADGMPLVWASRAFGHPLPERVAGSDLTPELMRLAEEKGYRVYFLGGESDVAREAVQRLRALHPRLRIAGYDSPPFRRLLEMDHASIVRRIQDARPDLLFVSLGCPKAEKWIAMNYRDLGVPVTISVGATIDFLANRFSRAPQWMRRSGLEWVYRLSREPRRLARRYLRDLWVFSNQIPRQWWHCEFSRPWRNGGSEIELIARGPTWVCIRIGNRLTRSDVLKNRTLWSGVEERDCLLDLSKVEALDGGGAGFLVMARNRLLENGRRLALTRPSRAVGRALQSLGLLDSFLMADNEEEALRAIELARQGGGASVSSSDGDVRIFKWKGEVTAANCHAFWKSLRGMMETARPGQGIEIDLSGIPFMDSSGLGILLKARRRADSNGISTKFTRPTENVLNVLRVSNLDRALLGEP